jgi:PiT family inorganic phosphate transporter
MMNDPTVIAVIVLAIVFDFFNGFHDSSNIVATMISSGATSPRAALILASVAEFSGPFLFGVAVAGTIGKEVVALDVIPIAVVLSMLVSAIGWNVATYIIGIPSSSSHALIGGLIGAAVVAEGFQVVYVQGLIKVFGALIGAPILGLAAGWIFMRLLLLLARGASPSINTFFKRAQILSSLALAFSHGTNDAQKTMGVITMALVIRGVIPEFVVPWWVILLSASAISLGVISGGWRIIATLGGRFYRIRPVHGFAAQTTAASVIMTAALLGGPVSTTQVVSSSIVGVGSAERLSKVRWLVVTNVATTWLLTIPISFAIGALTYMVVSRFVA